MGIHRAQEAGADAPARRRRASGASAREARRAGLVDDEALVGEAHAIVVVVRHPRRVAKARRRAHHISRRHGLAGRRGLWIVVGAACGFSRCGFERVTAWTARLQRASPDAPVAANPNTGRRQRACLQVRQLGPRPPQNHSNGFECLLPAAPEPGKSWKAASIEHLDTSMLLLCVLLALCACLAAPVDPLATLRTEFDRLEQRIAGPVCE